MTWVGKISELVFIFALGKFWPKSLKVRIHVSSLLIVVLILRCWRLEVVLLLARRVELVFLLCKEAVRAVVVDGQVRNVEREQVLLGVGVAEVKVVVEIVSQLGQRDIARKIWNCLQLESIYALIASNWLQLLEVGRGD